MKQFLRTGSLVLLLCSFYFMPAHAQDAEWTLLGEQNGVRIYRSYTLCNEQPHVLVKIENLNNKEVTVNWESKFTLMGNEVLTEDRKTATVASLTTITGNCQNGGALKINPLEFVSMFQPEVSEYLITNITVN